MKSLHVRSDYREQEMDLVRQLRRNIHCWGWYAALRNAKKKKVPFVCAYAAVFDRLPTRV